jgi:hypothetical protein
VNTPPGRGQALAGAADDADATFGDAPVEQPAEPCPAPEDTIDVFFDDPFYGPCRDVLVHLTYASGGAESMRTDFRGAIRVKKSRGVFVDARYTRAGETQKHRVYLRPEQAPGRQAAWQRLVNLGYVRDVKAPPSPPDDKLSRAVTSFQIDFQLEVTGELDEVTRQRIEKEHADRTAWQNREWPVPPEPTLEDQNLKGSLT